MYILETSYNGRRGGKWKHTENLSALWFWATICPQFPLTAACPVPQKHRGAETLNQNLTSRTNSVLFGMGDTKIWKKLESSKEHASVGFWKTTHCASHKDLNLLSCGSRDQAMKTWCLEDLGFFILVWFFFLFSESSRKAFFYCFISEQPPTSLQYPLQLCPMKLANNNEKKHQINVLHLLPCSWFFFLFQNISLMYSVDSLTLMLWFSTLSPMLELCTSDRAFPHKTHPCFMFLGILGTTSAWHS